MDNHSVAKVSTTIHAPASKVWDAITKPELIKQYLFGTDVISDWKVGSSIIYKGEWEGKPFEDKGTILEMEPRKSLVSTHWSPMSGVPDTPENYHKVSYQLLEKDGTTEVTITQDNNSSKEEQEQNANFWKMVLDGMKKLLES